MSGSSHADIRGQHSLAGCREIIFLVGIARFIPPKGDCENVANPMKALLFVVLLAAIPARAQPEIRSLRSEEHTSELQSHSDLVCSLLLEKKITRSPAPSVFF